MTFVFVRMPYCTDEAPRPFAGLPGIFPVAASVKFIIFVRFEKLLSVHYQYYEEI